MLPVSQLQVRCSLPTRETSADKALQQIDLKIRTGKEEALTDLFTALRTWRVNPKTYTQDKISPALKDRISALNSTSSELQSILEVALKFANANKGKFNSNEALILAIKQELKGLEKSIEPKKPRSSFCKMFFSVMKVAAVGMALIGGGLYASGSLRSASNGPIAANFSHFNGKPAFFHGDFIVDEHGAQKLYCPIKSRYIGKAYIKDTQRILDNPTLELGPNPYLEHAGKVMHTVMLGGQPIPVAPGGERKAVYYMEAICGENQDLQRDRNMNLFQWHISRITAFWLNFTESPLEGNF